MSDGAGLRRRIHHGCDVGRVRPHNEDVVLVDVQLGLSIVADGVGGHRAGDRAARLAAESVHLTLKDQTWAIDALRRQDPSVKREDVAKVIRFALQRANLRIYEEANQNPDFAGMATTCTLALDL
ncbi:MAG: protein phosphatase 2C domain-containing protein, partial [Myxococcota bacterium]